MYESSEERIERVLDIIAAGARESLRCEIEAFLKSETLSKEDARTILAEGMERAQQIRVAAKKKAEELLGVSLGEIWH